MSCLVLYMNQKIQKNYYCNYHFSQILCIVSLVPNFLFGILMNTKDNLVILLAIDDFEVLHHKIHILAERENIMGSSFYFFLIRKKKKKKKKSFYFFHLNFRSIQTSFLLNILNHQFASQNPYNSFFSSTFRSYQTEHILFNFSIFKCS